ncbi:unnamed protein product [Paramecium octaurelia]|uniref:Uncharacterized protein n=1 Tax=Paramecium octaurelia TaxID=43137 RepID=A0A8S1T0J0_PAROT|nr:unnamed protein product [Paramecium octaurelia]
MQITKIADYSYDYQYIINIRIRSLVIVKITQGTPRTIASYKPLVAKAQFFIVIKQIQKILKRKFLMEMQYYKLISKECQYERVGGIYNGGQFRLCQATSTFRIQYGLRFANSKSREKACSSDKPCFVPENSFKYFLARYPGKEEITKPLSEPTIHQKRIWNGLLQCWTDCCILVRMILTISVIQVRLQFNLYATH